jgi:hypothetical protein
MSASNSVLHVISINELRCLLWVTPCPQCGRGPQEILDADLQASPTQANIACQACDAQRPQKFDAEFPLQDSALAEPVVPLINPTDEASELLDLNQWLGLFHLFLERSALPDIDHSEHHHAQLWASACLDEALKFYDGEELEPEAAFRCDLSRQAYEQYPQSFDHQALLDWHAKLPPAPAWPE